MWPAVVAAQLRTLSALPKASRSGFRALQRALLCRLSFCFAQLLRRLRHPNVIQLLGIVEISHMQNRIGMVMEYMKQALTPAMHACTSACRRMQLRRRRSRSRSAVCLQCA